jgi:two-component system alkaline phosphatase synthesis response regulator PhoP
MSKKILIIEDDNMISSMYKTKLTQDGYEVFVAANGAQGLDLAMQEHPDLILLDIILPQLDGFSVLQELKSNKASTKDIPVIMLTNLSTEEDKDKGAKFGATDYLVKASLTPSQVSDTVKKYLGEAQ